ncbi:MAG TPA: tetratricopeptide repeat protein [Thermoanaerobaculia bacterium]|nr:tetratricopeptide repeat protein [Thermoanaerobaculia bacterium]
MRATVFTDEALTRQAGRFVWLAMDTEKAANAWFRTKYTVEALPTFFVVDPETDSPALKWVGGASVAQLAKILDDGTRAVAKHGEGRDRAMAAADRLFAAGKNKEAMEAYRDVLAKAPKSWKSWGRATESLLFAMSRSGENEACAVTARDAFPSLAKTASAANVAASGLGCALELKAEEPRRAELVAALLKDARAVLADTTTRIAPDDRSGLYETLVQERDEAKDEEGKKKVAAEWAAFLEGVVAKLKAPEARTAFDSHRLGAYIEMGSPEKAVPMLLESERALPDDYNPPARLALAYKAMGRFDEAIAASDRALARVYGPRKITVLRARADIFMAKGDKVAAKETIQRALEAAEALPEGQRSEGLISSLKKKLASMS